MQQIIKKLIWKNIKQSYLFLGSYYDPSYAVEPPFEQWETEGDPVSTSGWNK